MANMSRPLSSLTSVQLSPYRNTHLFHVFPSSDILAPPSSPPIPPSYLDGEDSDEDKSSNESEGKVEDEDDSESEDEGESENEDGLEGEGENINTPQPAVNTPQPAVLNTRRVGRGSSVAQKTNAILRQLRRMGLGFGTFV